MNHNPQPEIKSFELRDTLPVAIILQLRNDEASLIKKKSPESHTQAFYFKLMGDEDGMFRV